MEIKKFRQLNKKNVKYADDEEIIKKFMASLDFPDWFRGLSQVQMDAADSLLNCIRDDSEQGTSHRVRYALITLGIEPLVGSAKIKHAMRLSRGNDMAFLWFLMEMYYRNTCDQCEHKTGRYTVNEQLIITTVAHLDTITTLRELDRLLPKQPKPEKPKKIRPRKSVKPSCILPYFDIQRRPVSYGKSLTLNEVDSVDHLGQYEIYQNPNYVVPNECNRWFASYDLSDNERIAKRIVKDEIDGVFQREDEGLQDESFEELQNPLLCAHHVTMKAMMDNMANELKVEKQKAYAKYFDLDGQLKHKSYKRVVAQLNAEIAEAEETIQRIVYDSERMEKTLKGMSISKDSSNSGDWRASVNRTSKQLGKSIDLGHASIATDKPKYFEATTHHQPYKFNYNMIFDLGARDPVKEAVATALNAESSDAISLNHSRAIKKCCHDIWSTEVEKNKAEYAAKQKAAQEEEKKRKSTRLNFDLPYYDPRDDELMSRMLKEALQEMKKNKKFVLASLPNAYKFRILKVWIMKRYGMVYTRKEKRELFNISKTVFNSLNKNPIKIRIPKITDLSAQRVVSYGCQKHLLQKTNYLKEKYYHNFKTALLDYTRIFWGAIRPYQCSKGPPRNEFFSYMPARETDVHMFRPWKVTEYVPAKEEWDRKQILKRKKHLY